MKGRGVVFKQEQGTRHKAHKSQFSYIQRRQFKKKKQKMPRNEGKKRFFLFIFVNLPVSLPTVGVKKKS